MDKATINQRFITVVDYLISKKMATSKKEIAQILDLKQSTLSEILNNRSSVSAETIAKLCYNYLVSIDFIFKGEGEIVLNQKNFSGREMIEDNVKNVESIPHANNVPVVELLEKEVATLKEALKEAYKENGRLEWQLEQAKKDIITLKKSGSGVGMPELKNK